MRLILLAKIHDVLLAQAYGNSGKKVPKKQLILPTILPEDEQKKKKEKASMDYWRNQKELGFDDADFFAEEKTKKDVIIKNDRD